METLEKNRLIAEFMGVKPVYQGQNMWYYTDSPWFTVRNRSHEEVFNSIVKYVKYSTDWNWLMRVVDKIEELGYGVDIFGEAVSISKYYGDMVVDNNAKFYLNKIDAVYNAVVDFIVWYNQNKEQE
jgi:hypothetical protein